MFNDHKIRRILIQLIHEYRIVDGYHLGMYFDDDGSHSDHLVLYLWIENLLDKSPNISIEEIKNSFRKTVPEFHFC